MGILITKTFSTFSKLKKQTKKIHPIVSKIKKNSYMEQNQIKKLWEKRPYSDFFTIQNCHKKKKKKVPKIPKIPSAGAKRRGALGPHHSSVQYM